MMMVKKKVADIAATSVSREMSKREIGSEVLLCVM
jgi:hypothetical protein